MKFLLEGNHLKWIAAVTMLIDHIGVVLYPQIPLLRIIGRISFPIFAFLIVEGFHYTHDVRKYMMRILIFAFVSEVPFDLALYGKCFDLRHQNVLFTFFLALILLEYASKSRDTMTEAMVFIATMVLAYILRTDYSYFGILLIYFYAVSSAYKEQWKRVFPILLNLLIKGIQRWGILAAVPLYFYSGKEGRKMKYFFYIFYPGHLLVLYIIKRFL